VIRNATVLLAFLLFQSALVGCRAGSGRRPVETTAETLSREQDGGTKKMTGTDSKIDSLERTALRVGDAELTVTLDDAKAIEVALVDYLKKSDYEFREELLRWTGPAFIDAEGTVRIGLWVLGSRANDLYLRYRERPGQHMAIAHVASLSKKDGAWAVTNVVTEHLSIRR
jgi:hypothetical protein